MSDFHKNHIKKGEVNVKDNVISRKNIEDPHIKNLI